MAAGDQGLRDLVLYLPASLRDRAEEMASRESVSLNLFVAMAVAEKLQRLQLQRSLGTSERDELPGVTNAFSGSLIH